MCSTGQLSQPFWNATTKWISILTKRSSLTCCSTKAHRDCLRHPEVFNRVSGADSLCAERSPLNTVYWDYKLLFFFSLSRFYMSKAALRKLWWTTMCFRFQISKQPFSITIEKKPEKSTKNRNIKPQQIQVTEKCWTTLNYLQVFKLPVMRKIIVRHPPNVRSLCRCAALICSSLCFISTSGCIISKIHHH